MSASDRYQEIDVEPSEDEEATVRVRFSVVTKDGTEIPVPADTAGGDDDWSDPWDYSPKGLRTGRVEPLHSAIEEALESYDPDAPVELESEIGEAAPSPVYISVNVFQAEEPGG